MSANEQELRAALEAVEDPRMLHSLGELGMVREVRASRRGATAVLAVPGSIYSEQAELARRARQAADGVFAGDVEVQITGMVDAELAALRESLLALGRPPGGGGVEDVHVAGPGRVNPFMSKSSNTRVIGISSGKGGVGKSSVTVNLAVTLARSGHSVALLDADVYGFSVPRMLGVEHPPMVLEDVVIPPVAHGVRCISMGFFVDEEQAVMWRGPMLHKALEQFLVDVHWGKPDYLVVDMPPGTGDVALSMAQFLPRTELYVVTTPQAAAQRVAQRSAVMARQLKLPLRGVIENMSWFTGDDGKRYELFGAGGGEALASSLGVPLLARIPFEPALVSGGDDGRPVAVSDPGGEAGQVFTELAAAIVATGPARVYRKELSVR